MKTTTIILGSALLLAGCIPLQVLEQQQQGSGAIMLSPLPIPLPAESSSSSQKTGTGALAERIVERGILEVGNSGALLTLTVFTNYSCAYCNEFTRDMLPQLGERFMRPGQLNVRLVNTPLKKYPNSGLESSALICASALGKGYDMHMAMTESPTRDRKTLLTLAKNLGLVQKDFTACLDAKETASLKAEQQTLIESHQVTLIPTFILMAAPRGAEGALRGEKRVGLPTYPDLRGWITETIPQR